MQKESACRARRAGLLLVPILGMLPLFGGGCATAPSVPVTIQEETSRLPSTFLEGAGVREARSVAMASARSKGWIVVSSDEEKLVVERAIPADSPQAMALGAAPGTPAPRVRVHSHFVPLERGTEVRLSAFVLANPGTEAERLIDYTDDYSVDLRRSLSSLRSAWLATSHRLASPAPVPGSPPPPAPDDPGLGRQPPSQPEEQAARPEQETQVPRTAGSVWTDRDSAALHHPEPRSAPGADRPWRDLDMPWPESNLADSWQTPPEDDLTGTRDINQMLVLDTGSRTGVWAYYAERFAEQQGCIVDAAGAVLLRKESAYELHEVGCINGANRLVRCQGGVCQAMR